MRLYLIRHGEADANPIDSARRLTRKGQRDISLLGRRLAAAEAIPADAVWLSSPYARARESAEGLRAEVPASHPLRIRDDLVPEASPATIAAWLNQPRHSTDTVITGHNPHLSLLLALLLGGPDGRIHIAFKKAGCACLEQPQGSPVWMLKYYLVPKFFR
jgi:phosphohistidine phosphatase SixA